MMPTAIHLIPALPYYTASDPLDGPRGFIIVPLRLITFREIFNMENFTGEFYMENSVWGEFI